MEFPPFNESGEENNSRLAYRIFASMVAAAPSSQKEILSQHSQHRVLSNSIKGILSDVTGNGYDSSEDPDDEQSDEPNDQVEVQPSKPIDPDQIGMTSSYKRLYSGKEDRHGRFIWKTTIPKDIGDIAEDEESLKYALIVRHIRVYNDPKRIMKMHSIVIQSPLLKELLVDILANYPGVTVNLKRLEFSGRFEPLIHRWTGLKNAITELKQKEAGGDGDPLLSDRIEHAELLNKLLIDEFADIHESTEDMTANGVITYEHLWTIFQPNSIVFSRHENQDRAFRLQKCKYGVDRNNQPVLYLHTQFVDYDGSRFGVQKISLCIPEFEGTRPIAGLPIFPFAFHDDPDAMKNKLMERGRKIEVLAGSHYRTYDGVGWKMGAYNNKDKYPVKGRIVIDTLGFNRYNPDHAVYVFPMNQQVADASDHFRPPPHRGSTKVGASYGAELDFDDGGMPPDGYYQAEDAYVTKQTPLTDEQKLICNVLVRGYALKEKVWLNLFVNAVQDVTFNEQAFDTLVLPANQKELVMGFASTKQNYSNLFDDVIQGKGRGIIMLLCGPPGVGKTLTAESVAEHMRVPLYTMSAGDLGLDPRTVEVKLQNVLEMCTRWNAILLIDEADVFLEARNLHELERNKLVSIFLRVLEYFEGIMFLTTNRVETFDPAFQSRIHISLQYKELDKPSRKAIWTTFLEKHNVAQLAARERPLQALATAAKASSSLAKLNGTDDREAAETERELITRPHDISANELRRLADLKINGRQIKNVLKTAQLTAVYKREPLRLAHIEQAMEATQDIYNMTRESETAKSAIFN